MKMQLSIEDPRAVAFYADHLDARIAELRNSPEADEDELESLLDEVSFKWNRETGEAHFNGYIANETVDSARKMLGSMKKLKNIKLFINSPGGSAVAGVALYNMLRDAKQEVEGVIIGMAYSAASMMFLGADKRLVATGGILGIHKSWTLAIGNADDMLDVAERLDRMDGSIRAIYKERSKESKYDEVAEAMAKDTALTAEEAIDLGMADGVYKFPDKKEAAKPKAAPKEEKKAKPKVKVDVKDAAREWPEEVAPEKAEPQEKAEASPRGTCLAEIGFYKMPGVL